MGTRNVTMVISNKEIKVAQYGQFDGYPSGLGIEVINKIKTMKVGQLKEKLEGCRFITDAEHDALDDKTWLQDMPQLDRSLQVDIIDMIMDGTTVLEDSRKFPADSLFCEWGYVIDLDKEVLEVYKGFNLKPLPKNARFKHLEADMKENGTYYPIKLATKIRFQDLPKTQHELELFADEKFRKLKATLKDKVALGKFVKAL
jgi:hypothetical protein